MLLVFSYGFSLVLLWISKAVLMAFLCLSCDLLWLCFGCAIIAWDVLVLLFFVASDGLPMCVPMVFLWLCRGWSMILCVLSVVRTIFL